MWTILFCLFAGIVIMGVLTIIIKLIQRQKQRKAEKYAKQAIADALNRKAAQILKRRGRSNE